MSKPYLILLATLFALGTACSESDPVDETEADEEAEQVAAGDGTEIEGPSEPIAIEDGDIEAIVEDLNDYWSQVDEELGFEYTPVPASRVTDATDGATCNGEVITEEEVEENAFVDSGCEEGVTVAFDRDYVEDSLARAEATLAHEWGHVIQAQATEIDLSLDSGGLPIDGELQADCFAGAWASRRAIADIQRLRQDVQAVGDPEEVGIDDPHAHGTAEERLAAFDLGLGGGPTACVDQLVSELPG